MLNNVLDSWKKYAAGLFFLGWINGYSQPGTMGYLAAEGGNLLLLALLLAVLARAIWRRAHRPPVSAEERAAKAERTGWR